MGDQYGLRCSGAAKRARRAGSEALLVTSRENVRYLSGFTGEDSWLILAGRKRLIITDSRFTEEASESCPSWEVHRREGGIVKEAGDILRSMKLRTGYESGSMKDATARSLRKAVGSKARLVATVGIVEGLREVKDACEIAVISKAARAAERGMRRALAEVHRDATENEFAASLEYFMRLEGAEGAAFATIAASEPRSSLPHATPSGARLLGGGTFLADWGARVEGYNSDLTRVIAAGKVSRRIGGIWKAVKAASRAALGVIRAGVAAKTVDAAARRVIADAGYGEFFGHGLGHGVGLEVHEAPFLGGRSLTRLRAGMVVTVEPGIYLPGEGGVRLEDMVLVTSGGCRLLTRIVREPRQLGRLVCT